LDYQPSKREMVPDLVVVEGKNDFYTLKYIHALFLKSEYPDLNLYPGNGAGGNGKIIRLYSSWGRNFIVLSDGDTAGENSKQTYLDEIGPVVQNRIFTLKDVSKNFKNKAMENIFSSSPERIRIIQSIFPKQKTFSKIKFNQAIQNLSFLKQSVQLNKSSLDNFRKIFSFLNQKLSETSVE
jgi:hypothetical protein